MASIALVYSIIKVIQITFRYLQILILQICFLFILLQRDYVWTILWIWANRIYIVIVLTRLVVNTIEYDQSECGACKRSVRNLYLVEFLTLSENFFHSIFFIVFINQIHVESFNKFLCYRFTTLLPCGHLFSVQKNRQKESNSLLTFKFVCIQFKKNAFKIDLIACE